MERIRTLLNQAKQGDKEARNTLIEENIGLVWSIVRRFTNRGYDPDDLFQIGAIGLMKAIDYFNTDFDVKFSTYAVPMITGEIKRFLRDDGMIKVSRSIKDNAYKIRCEAERLYTQFGRDATTAEISAATGISCEDIVVALEAQAEVESLQKVIYQGDGNTISLMDKIENTGDNEGDVVVDKLFIKELLKQLTEDERRIITQRYYLRKTQSQIAKEMGISQVQVSRIEKRTLESMRQKIL